ncbi:beta-ketoacyl synthase N-terminal-like domain-containing protein [Kitasatospora aburaviensis]
MGLVTPVGRKPAEVFDALAAGRSGIRALPEDHAAHGWLTAAGIAPPVDGREVLPPTETRCVDRFVLLALAAADDALADADLVVGRDADPHRTAVVLATGGAGWRPSSSSRTAGWSADAPASARTCCPACCRTWPPPGSPSSTGSAASVRPS